MLGVLGGMGPVATIDFMNKVVRHTPAKRDQDHIPMVVRLATDIPDRTAAILGHGEDPLPALRSALRDLEIARATVIAIPCNTAHFWYDALQAETSIPILHIVEAAADTLPAGADCVGILATTGTVKAEIYQRAMAKRGIRCTFPSGDEQVEVMRAVQLMKEGDAHAAGAMLTHQAEELLKAGCDMIMMACTEIPIAMADAVLAPNLIDPTEALAMAAVRACLAERAPGLAGTIDAAPISLQ
jgi:aspartate racemase